MGSHGKRKAWSAAEKLRIVLLGLDGTVDVSEICRREGVNPTQFYGWRKQLLGSAAKVFGPSTPVKSSIREERLAQENERLKSVVVEITTENLELKKGLSD
jgi:transposase-like protein